MMKTRVNPRYVAPGLFEEEERPPEDPAKAYLMAMCRTSGWEIARGNLKRRLRWLEMETIQDPRMDEEGLRKRQAIHRLLRELVEDPVGFFTDEPGAAG